MLSYSNDLKKKITMIVCRIFFFSKITKSVFIHPPETLLVMMTHMQDDYFLPIVILGSHLLFERQQGL